MRNPLTLLAELPALAAEVFLTRDAPNPAPRADRNVRGVPGSRPPINLDVWDALRTDPKGDLALLHGWAITIDEVSDGELAPIPEQTPTWVGVCRYLTETHTWWQTHDLAADCTKEINTVHGRLRTLARTPAPPRYKCDQCGAPAHPQPGGMWMMCDNGHQVEGLGAVRERLQSQKPMTARQLQDEYHIDPAEIRRWKQARIIKPVGTAKREGRGRPADLWNVYDILQAQRGVLSDGATAVV